jgi:hypothetical protein
LLDDAEADEVVMLSKIDLSDGFWRMLVASDKVWNFCYVLPDPPGHPIRIVVPSALQMGWAQSPAFFCAVTETGRDIIQGLVAAPVKLPPIAWKNTCIRQKRQNAANPIALRMAFSYM